ncbi:MAG: tetratricopeptide repeat protein [Cyclobacteriaceae bacterium]|nr:tetratricopeptide repeat protein [Cyclobacteriaceae bacterium]
MSARSPHFAATSVVFTILLMCACAWATPCSAAPQDTLWVKTRLDTAWKMMLRNDPRTVSVVDSLIWQAKELKFKPGLADAYRTLARHYRSSNGKMAERYYDSALAINLALNRKLALAKVYQEMGSLYYTNEKFSMSIEFSKKSSALDSALGRKQQMADALTNIGLAYERLGDYAQALRYYLRCLAVDEELKYEEGIVSDYSVIATIHGKMGDFEKASEYYQKAIDAGQDETRKAVAKVNYAILLKNHGHYDESLKLMNEAYATYIKGDEPRNIASALHNLGALAYAMGDYPGAISYYNQAFKIADPDYKSLYQANYTGLAETYLKIKQYPRALEYANQAMTLVMELGLMDSQRKTAKLISDIYRAQGNFEQSLVYYEKYSMYRDSVFSQEKVRQIRDLQAKFDSERKEQEIAALTFERELQSLNLERKTILQYSLIAGFLVLAIVGIILFRINLAKQAVKRQLLSVMLSNEHKEAERLKELDHLKSRFFANVAHEFRTPLTLILGPVENMLSETKGPDKNRLLTIKSSASRLVKLVNQLLELSKLEAGAIELDFVQDDVIGFLRANTMSFQSLADQKKIDLQFSSNTAIFEMKFDRDKLEKIFSNLLSNAFKFTDAGGSILVHADAGQHSLRVTVKDSGTGVPEADLPFVFNRFYQSGTVSRTTLGSGIGLELTKELVNICGGEVGVSNAIEGGAQFYFTLPVTEPGAADVSSNKPTSGEYTRMVLDEARQTPGVLAMNTNYSEGKDTILVIEDNADVRNYIISSLQPDYHVISADDGEHGIREAIEIVPDLVITDLMMPVTDGMTVCRTLKKDERTSHIPVIMLTAKADMESKIEGLESGADDYLAKPFHTKELLARIANQINIRKSLQEKFRSGVVKEESDQHVSTKEKIFMAKLLATVELHLGEEEFGVEELSRELAMSRMQLHRKIKALTNIPASLYIRSVRLEHAKRLLGEGIYNVSEVAYRVGFNSPTWFSTCFSEQYGFPPSDLLTTTA